MALLVCLDCTTRFSVGAKSCPHCLSTNFEEDNGMPKITVHGGPSVAGASVVGGSWSNGGDPDVWPEPASGERTADDTALREHARNLVEPDFSESLDRLESEEGEESSAGTSSSTSPEKPSNKPEKNEAETPSPAPTTASRSKKARTGSRSARSTAGGQEADTSASND